ncbi:malonyl-CoA decarboxylase [Neptunomonas antarctica]|uniref:Malonyl-CoA decarboxylase n=2 Tax=Neptunomonas antarctica TaxID=619304 RepID=A0A1N7N6G9_9GAMM|nr:malonyl-CoA decarboxylase [Neptunomonas antarctica]
MRLNELLNSVAEAGREILSKRDKSLPEKTLETHCANLLSNKGEALGSAFAMAVVIAYRKSNEEEKLKFFYHLLESYSPNPELVIQRANEYKASNDYKAYAALNDAVESPRQMLFRRINMAPNGTETLVELRCDLLRFIKNNPELKTIDYDLSHLLKSWFNRGFLTLEEIRWDSPAVILEKLIKYEAVHYMSGWEDLKKRLGKNRRCYAFFHPSLPGEPLIFVEVALVKGLADSIPPLIDPTLDASISENKTDTAIFYSISNCQAGLAGISFGNFLIKQVVMELKRELPHLTQFSTLSPIPGFLKWLSREQENGDSEFIKETDRDVLSLLGNEHWYQDQEISEAVKPVLMGLCKKYLFHAKRGKLPCDPVARFHLGNGARIERLNWMGDKSANGLDQSAGMLVNYFYEISEVEKNHEAFINDGVIATSKDFKRKLSSI